MLMANCLGLSYAKEIPFTEVPVWNGYGDTSSNPGHDWLYFT